MNKIYYRSWTFCESYTNRIILPLYEWDKCGAIASSQLTQLDIKSENRGKQLASLCPRGSTIHSPPPLNLNNYPVVSCLLNLLKNLNLKKIQHKNDNNTCKDQTKKHILISEFQSCGSGEICSLQTETGQLFSCYLSLC